MRSCIIIIILFFSTHSSCQSWIADDNEKASYITNLHYASFNDVLKGCDSAYYLFTQHQPEEYWKDKNKDKGELLVSRVDAAGNITFLRKLGTHAEKTLKAIFNNEYYFLDLSPTEIRGKYYYKGFVYNSKWENERTFMIEELTTKKQRGFPGFVIDKNENIYVYSAPSYLDHRPQDFTGCYLLKCDKEGNRLKDDFFDKCEIIKLGVSDTGLSIKIAKEKYDYPYYVTDSIISLTMDFQLTPVKATTVSYNKSQRERDVMSSTTLYTGEKVVIYDSSYPIKDNGTMFVKKIAFYNADDTRRWVNQIPKAHSYSEPRALKNGNYMITVYKRSYDTAPYDTICLSQFDRTGAQKLIKSFLDGNKPELDRYFISYYYFEPRIDEIWLFYQKGYFRQDERIYFMKLSLN